MIVSSAFQHLLAGSNDEMSKAARVKSVGFNVLESNALEKGGLTFLLEQKLFVKGKLMVMIVKPPGGNFKQQQQKSSVVRVQLGPIFSLSRHFQFIVSPDDFFRVSLPLCPAAINQLRSLR